MRHSVKPVSLAITFLVLFASISVAQDSNDACTATVVPLIDQAGLLPETSAPSVGCRQDNNGAWYMPELSDALSADLLEELDPKSQGILDAIDRMSTDNAFASSLRFNRHDMTILVPGRGGVTDTIDVGDYRLGYVPSWMHNLQNGYNRSMQTYLTRTSGTEVELVYYMQWYMARRDVTLSTMSLYMNPLAASAFLSNWGYEQLPWPWQLADPLAIAEYNGQTLPGPESDAATAVPTSTPSGSSVSSTDGLPVFSPSQLTVVPGENVDITVSLSPTTFGGAFFLTVMLPSGVDLITMPQCSPEPACEGAAVQTDIGDNPNGETTIQITGFLMDRDNPVSFGLTVRISEQAVSGEVLQVKAGVGFSSHSAPPDAGGESLLDITVTRPAA